MELPAYDEIDEKSTTRPFWNDEEQDIFRKSSRLHFHLPFNDVQREDNIAIDCEYIESLPLVQGYYYLRIPLLFFDWELKSSMLEEDAKTTDTPLENKTTPDETNFERRVKVHCRINHGNSMKVGVMCCLFFIFHIIFLFVYNY